jgi:hypothetical protein
MGDVGMVFRRVIALPGLQNLNKLRIFVRPNVPLILWEHYFVVYDMASCHTFLYFCGRSYDPEQVVVDTGIADDINWLMRVFSRKD